MLSFNSIKILFLNNYDNFFKLFLGTGRFDMTFEQLRALQAVVAEGTFRAAAAKLNKSQPALSLMVQKLEAETGIELFSRAAYRPVLTAAGAIFHREATKTLHQMQALQTVAAELAAREEAEVSVAVTATCPLPTTLAVIAAVRADYPTTQIRLTTESMGGPVERLLAGDADIVIAAMDGIPVQEVEAVPYLDIDITPVAHPAYPPAASARLLTITEMQPYPQVVVADSSTHHEQSRDVLPGVQQWTVSDFAAKKEIILAQLGWGGMPSHLITGELSAGKLVPLRVAEFPVRHTTLFLIRRRDARPGRTAQQLWTALRDSVSA